MIAAGGLPVLAHLLSQKGGRLAVFPAVRFIEQAAADISRLLRPRHWLLMALRIAALSLLVLAFTQPVWYRTAQSPATRRGVGAAIIIDATASMNRTYHGVTLLDQAKRQARQLLEQLDPTRDRAVIILLDHQPRSLLPEASANFSALAAALDQVQPTQQAGQLVPAVRLAGNMLRQGEDEPARQMRIELLSDSQLSGGFTAAQNEAQRLGLPLTVHQIGAFNINAALFDPTAQPTGPIVGQSATFAVAAANFGPEMIEPTIVLRVGTPGNRLMRQRTKIMPFSTTTVSFQVSFSQPGPTVVRFEFDKLTDALDSDNDTGICVDVSPARPVEVITGADVNDPGSASYFVAAALAPDISGEMSGVAVSFRQPQALSALRDNPGRDPMVFVIVEAGLLNDAALRTIVTRLDGGDGVLWIIDSPAAVESLRRFCQLDPNRVISPIVPPGEHAWQSQRERVLALGNFDEPILWVFEGPARSGLLGNRFSRGMSGTLSPVGTALLSYADGSPALATAWVGSGRLAVWAGDVGPLSSAIAKGPMFAPLIHQLIRHLAPGPPGKANRHPGQWVGLNPEQGELIIGPDGQHMDEASGYPRYLAQQVGLYRLMNQAQPTNSRPSAQAWVELDEAESDLRVAEVLADDQDSAGESDLATQSQAAGPPVLRPRGVELWPFFALGGLLFVAIESVTLLMLGRGRVLHGEAGHV